MKNRSLYIPLAYTIVREIPRYNRSIFESICCTLSSYLFYYIWIPLYALFLLSRLTDLSMYSELAWYIFAFAVLYETGYLISDYYGAKREDKKLKRVVLRNLSFRLLSLAVIIRLVLMSTILVFLKTSFEVVILYVLTLSVFIVHSMVIGKYRLATFMGLRVLKGLVPYATVVYLLPPANKLLILSALIGHGIHQSMEYYPRKLGARILRTYYVNKKLYIRFLTIATTSVLFSLIFSVNMELFIIFIIFIALHHIFYVIMVDITHFLKRIGKVFSWH